MAADPNALKVAVPDANLFQLTYEAVRDKPLEELGVGSWARREVEAANHDRPDLVVGLPIAGVPELVAAKKRFLFGTTFAEVAVEALRQIAVCRKLGAPQELVRDLIFSIFLAYTVARDWVVEYNKLHSSSILRRFEIVGRQVARDDPDYAKNNWVNTSNMNATAAHILGYMAVETAPAGGALARLKAEKGTPFSDLKLATEQGEIITELAKTLSANDRDALTAFKNQFGVLVAAVDMIFGASGVDIAAATARANKFKPSEF